MTEERVAYAIDYATEKKAPPQFSIGDKVRHPFYGVGQIIGTRAFNGETQYHVQFAVVKPWLFADNLKREKAK